jgi:hypothetical protein
MGSSLLNLLYYLQNLYDVANSWRRHGHDAHRQIQNVQENSKRFDSIDLEQLMTHDLLHGGTAKALDHDDDANGATAPLLATLG